jgi:mono/diheme cytochrome c family protein
MAAFALAVSGCAAGPSSRAAGDFALQVRAVDWNPGRAPIAGVRAVADLGNDVVAFADGAATVLSGGRVVAVDHAVATWVSAGTLPAADGSGTWIIGVDGEGRVRRLLGKATLEPVSDRFGLADAHVLAVASLGGASAAFRLKEQLAVADGAQVTRYATGPVASFAGGGGRAVLGGDPLRVLDVVSKRVSAFAIPKGSRMARPAFVTVTPRGKLFVATKAAIWSEDDRGDLALCFRSPDEAIHGLVASADRVWFADGTELGVIDNGRVRLTSGANVSAAAELAGSPSGDVWTLTAGALARYEAPLAGVADWNQTVAPVFQRVCSSCHTAGGEAGVSLATEEAWEKRRDKIVRRVFVDRDMPPPPRALTDAERAAIRVWLDR